MERVVVFVVIVNIFIFIKVLAYGLYEIKQENNKFGGIAVISFSCFVVIFANVVLWLK